MINISVNTKQPSSKQTANTIYDILDVTYTVHVYIAKVHEEVK